MLTIKPQIAAKLNPKKQALLKQYLDQMEGAYDFSGWGDLLIHLAEENLQLNSVNQKLTEDFERLTEVNHELTKENHQLILDNQRLTEDNEMSDQINRNLMQGNDQLTNKIKELQKRIPPKLPVVTRKLSIEFKTKMTDADTINLLYYYAKENGGAPYPYKKLLKESMEANLLKLPPKDS